MKIGLFGNSTYTKEALLLIQEIKTIEETFPFSEFKSLGYKSYVYGQKSYNGVAIVSKYNINKVDLQFIKDKKKAIQNNCRKFKN